MPLGRRIGTPAQPVWQADAERAAGFLIGKEVRALERVLASQRLGFVAVLGGAKVSDKIGVIENLLARVERILIGGAMAYTFLAAQGVKVGASRIEEEHLPTARRIMQLAKERGVEVGLPGDHVAADRFAADAVAQVLPTSEISDGLWVSILDRRQQTWTFYGMHAPSSGMAQWVCLNLTPSPRHSTGCRCDCRMSWLDGGQWWRFCTRSCRRRFC